MSLSQMQSLAAAAVLERCTQGLKHHEDKLSEDIRQKQKTIETFNSEGCSIKAKEKASEKEQLITLKTSSQFISRKMSELHFELVKKQSYSSLLKAVMEEEDKGETACEVDQKRQELLRQKMIEDKMNTFLGKAMAIKTEGEGPLVHHPSQTQQPDVLCNIDTKTQQAKNQLNDQIELLKKELEEEKRNHEESIKFLQKQQMELQQELNKWNQQTEQILQEKQEKFYNLSCKKTLTFDRLVELNRKFREMKQVVLEDKKEQEKQRQVEAKDRAATKLQAWWRSCMVRRGLGPFKKALEKKGKKKKGNQEKGKNKNEDQKKGKKDRDQKKGKKK